MRLAYAHELHALAVAPTFKIAARGRIIIGRSGRIVDGIPLKITVRNAMQIIVIEPVVIENETIQRNIFLAIRLYMAF